MEYANWPGLSHISTLTLWWIQSHMCPGLRDIGGSPEDVMELIKTVVSATSGLL